jgi:hypothetical protein
LLFAVGMVILDPRRIALLLALAACATDDEADVLDVDGDGKADGATSTDPNRLLDVPFYFSVPKDAVTTTLDRSKYPYPTLWNNSTAASDVGLRIIAVQQGTGVSGKKAARREMSQKLAQAGVLQDGDVVLTFRPELAGSMAYPHIQMGSTHAGLVYVENGVAYNIDSPLDSTYVGQFDAAHYAGDGANDAGADALHIVRPHGMTETRRAQLRDWIKTLKSNLADINGARAQVKFQSDYLVPSYVSAGLTTRQTVTTLGKIILEADTTTKLPMYCSEFAWHMLALSSCTADEIRNAPADGASCVDDIFAPMPLVASDATEVGMADGPLLTLLKLPAPIRLLNVAKIFETGNPAKLSSGHRMVSEQVAPLMGPLSQLYTARAQGAPIEATAEGAKMLSANMPNNYSPTAFLVQAIADPSVRTVDYVVTLAFVNAAGYSKAKRLAQNPVP